jgi:2'-5' RNA ligase
MDASIILYMVRAFVALELSSEIRSALKAAQETLHGGRTRLTFVDPCIIHITVKFLGDVEDKKIPLIKNALAEIMFSPFPVTVGPVTVNSRHNPRTIWCNVDDGGKTIELLDLVEPALVPLGFARETRKFTPHATIARIKSFDASLFPRLDQLAGKTFGECMIQGLKLKKSTLMPTGPSYEDLLEVNW